jgi:hypothetical protein
MSENEKIGSVDGGKCGSTRRCTIGVLYIPRKNKGMGKNPFHQKNGFKNVFESEPHNLHNKPIPRWDSAVASLDVFIEDRLGFGRIVDRIDHVDQGWDHMRIRQIEIIMRIVDVSGYDTCEIIIKFPAVGATLPTKNFVWISPH